MNAKEEEFQALLTITETYQYRHHKANTTSRHGKSVINLCLFNRNREECHTRLYHHYFSYTPTCPNKLFRRIFQRRRS